jgi:hypothetical protein
MVLLVDKLRTVEHIDDRLASTVTRAPIAPRVRYVLPRLLLS